MSDEGGNAKEQVKERSNMKRTMFFGLLLVGLAGLTGCVMQHGRRPWACMGGSCAQAPENCRSCDASCGASCDASCDTCEDTDPACKCKGLLGRLRRQPAMVEAEPEAPPPGPATGTVTYPYYTTRGPRDFLAKNPPSIGP